ncbi:MAG: bifunctional diaminohydroxyphosphoribosylaminopyrimidine deaminase/5-amino-6-(5-phosphoribosylamino)uracil reductase RibD [Bacteroidia bacterium]|nr:bifunctional diaminohydroxyphosphoribosylaminopyrimidine deaminase/5-amino-6-(5-phosphoribosylamino)uracil reductase RibD [Bacteroidia bacterium]
MYPQIKYMQRCLELAVKGLGSVSPNPMVGCVIVKDDRIIGEGFHEIYGGPHAEVNAIQNACGNFSGDEVMYVSLEPCNHHGKTPPCTELILQSGIRNVIIACSDIKQNFEGNGAQRLRKEGVNVIKGFMEKEARELNQRFFIYHEKKRPYIILKWAQTADGFIGHAGISASRLVVSNQEAHILVHRWRSEEDAIMAGANTLLTDNPQLTTRLWKGKNPARVFIDRNLSLPQNLNVFDNNARVFILNEKKTLTDGHLQFIKTDCGNLNSVLEVLHGLQIQSLLVEGGTKTLNRFLEKNLYDEMRIIVSPHYVGNGVKAPVVNLAAAEIIPIGNNKLFQICNRA